ncbi:MAG: phosphotransferase [Caldilineaceae bacterium]|nr:phosphotransferase [Caldilineaceae bacterium]
MSRSYQTQLPDAVRMRAQTLGDVGAQWVASLDDCVRQLAAQWALTIGGVLSGGSEGFVAHVRLGDGRAAILKIGLPGSADLSAEAKVYQLAAGRGYAELFAHDPERNAILLERLGAPLRITAQAIDTQIRVLCETLHEAWMPLDSAQGLMTGAQKAQWLAAFIAERWRLLGRPCDKRTIDRALEYCEERADAYTPEHSVLVHGDAHADNALLLDGTGRDEAPHRSLQCKFVDPDGLFAEKACDLAVLMRDWSDALLAHNDPLGQGIARCELLSALTGVDAHAIWQWGFMERVSTGLVLLEIGMKKEGEASLAVAEHFCSGGA